MARTLNSITSRPFYGGSAVLEEDSWGLGIKLKGICYSMSLRIPCNDLSMLNVKPEGQLGLGARLPQPGWQAGQGLGT